MVEIRAADIRLYEPFVERVKATPALKSVGYDDDDMQSLARIAVWKAIEAWRQRPNAEPGGVDELKWVRRSIKNALITKIRYAGYERRRPLDRDTRASIQTGVYGTHLAGAFGHAAEVTETPAEEVARKEREDSIQRAANKVRQSIGPHRYKKLLEVVDDRRRNLTALRGIFGLTLVRMEDAMADQTTEETTTERAPVEVRDLTDDELGRVALVHNKKVPAFVRSQLLRIVTELNNGEPFPPCFRNPAEYNPDLKDESGSYPCRDECDFRQECRANISAFANPVIEEGLKLLKSPPVIEEPVKEVKKPEPKSVEKPAKEAAVKNNKKLPAEPPPDRPKADFTPASEVGQPPDVAVGQVFMDLDPRTKGKRLVVVTEISGPVAVVMNIEGKPVSKIPVKKLTVLSPKKGFALVGENDPKVAFAEPEVEKAKVVELKDDPSKPAAKKGKPSKPEKQAKPKKEKADVVPVTGLFFSARRGVLPAGRRGYAKNDKGERFYRMPQGLAGFLRQCPVGTTAEREWNGHVFKVKKITDDGVKSVWRLVSKDGEAYAKPMEDTIGKITFHITKNNAWSAAKFWNMLPPELKKDSGKFNPEAAVEKYSVYGKGGDDEQASA